MLYQICHGAVSFGDEEILHDINFEIRNTEKIAVVGRNGCGKTTLLKLIHGEVDLEKRDSDEDVFIAKAGNPQIGYLKQIAFEDPSITLEQEVRKVFKNKVYQTVIPRNVRLGEAPSHGLPIHLYDPRSLGADSYRRLAQEFLQRNR